MKNRYTILWCAILLALFSTSLSAQQSTARRWNEALLSAIRVDVARPTVHARNLWHLSMAMYDAWAVYDATATPYLLGSEHFGFSYPLGTVMVPADATERKAFQDEAVSYAAYRLLVHRFQNSPGATTSLAAFQQLMADLGYDTAVTSTDYSTGSAAALGNYLAEQVIAFGLRDNSREQNNYTEPGYIASNTSLSPTDTGTVMQDINRWQPLSFSPGTQTPFLGPHWGKVYPFSLSNDQLEVRTRDGYDYYVYLDPGPPSYHSDTQGGLEDDFKWNHAMVAVWSGHLDANSGVMVDISPANLGNITNVPTNMAEMRQFYDFLEGNTSQDIGYAVNPVTGQPYSPQVVPFGDFARVVSEFWADGPSSETPPGHWFTILNSVNDHPLFEKRYRGEGPVLDDLEWDVKAYFALGGAVHDVAVAVWGVKAWYDSSRPISAIRAMAALGQSSNPALPSYNAGGLPLIPGHIELIEAGDPLAGENGENIGRLKIYAWRAHSAIADPVTDEAGVGWILAETWWPYQKKTFVTPPFAGYVSGHSTFSRAAAQLLATITGDDYFPGGMGEFTATQNQYLTFEDGPSVDVTLQWAKYSDASDQASLSRIWGGIHPPVDDCPGRQLGSQISEQAIELAEEYFNGFVDVEDIAQTALTSLQISNVYPNPVQQTAVITCHVPASSQVSLEVTDLMGRSVQVLYSGQLGAGKHAFEWNTDNPAIPQGIYICRLTDHTRGQQAVHKLVKQ